MAPPPATRHNPQSQPLTTLLRLICESYPPNTCLRELLQNADDAGATEIEYILDTNTYIGEPLLHEALAEYQGPALLARNNSVFTDEDLASLSAVGDSRKRHDAESTGKFGQGFNSVYHFTDGPWVYSRSLLLMLDPHKTWSRRFSPDAPGGPMWDVVADRDSAEIHNHINTFGAFDLDYTRSNDETIIRIPLRTREQAKTSKIFQDEISIKNIEDALEDFGQEIEEGGLLFLKHVRKIVIRVNHDIILLAQVLNNDLNSANMRKAIPTDFKQRYAPNNAPEIHNLSKTFETRIEISTKQYPNSRLFRYIVQHTMMTSSGDKNLDVWARERKLYPWVAIAAPLKDGSAGDPFYGRLFSTLRLPVRTNQPVHIHGLFSTTPDRGRLSSSGQSPGYEDLATRWNTFMFDRCVSTAWASLLAYRSGVSWREEMFALWPRAEFAHSELWDKLDNSVIDIVINNNLTVWNASNGCCVDVNHGFFASDDVEAKNYGPALAAASLPAVYLEGSLLRKLKQRAKLLQRDVRMLTPVTVRQFLRQYGLPALSSEILFVLLEFCLLDAIKCPQEQEKRDNLYNDLHGIHIWPTVSGDLSCSDHADLMLPRDDAEMQLFSKSRDTKTLDISKMSPTVRKLLLSDIGNLAAVMKFRGLEDLAIDWPVMYPMVPRPENSRGWAKRAFGLDEVLHNTWAWIARRVQEGQRIVLEPWRDLWLVPMNDFRVRRFSPKGLRNPLLVIEKQDPLFNSLVAMTKQNPLEMPPLLDNDVLPQEARGLLRTKGPMKTDTQCTCVDDPDPFVDWLVAGKEMLAKASDEEKAMFLSHLETLTRDSKLPAGLSPTLISQLRKLPLYSKISCSAPFDSRKRSHTKRGLDTGSHMYWTPKSPSGFPPLPDIVGVSFYDPQNEIERLMMGRLRALQDVTPKDLLTLHLLPWMESISSDAEPLWKTPKANLIDWIMKGSRRPSKAWLTDIISHPIIPLPLQGGNRQYRCLMGMVDPSSELAKLYDEKENIFPCPEFFSRHKEALIACGIATQPTWSTPADRVRRFSQRQVDIETLQRKVDCLLKLPVQNELISSTCNIEDIRKLRWLPGVSLNGESMLLAPNECRGADQSQLVDLVWGTTNITVKASWKKVLGWDQSIPTEVLLEQLDLCLATQDHDKAGKVLHQIKPDDYSVLALKPCFLGRCGNYFTIDKVFLPGSQLQSRPLAPYLDELDAKFAKDHERLVTGLGIQSQPSVRNLQDVQDALQKTVEGCLSISDLGIAITTLEIATRLGYEPQDLRIPDATMILRELQDIVHGDPLSTGDIAGFNFTHPEISNDLARRLDVENSLKRAIRLRIDFDSEDEDDYTPKEKLRTVIADTLERYPIQSTFNEFLANADDAGATKITWILDECRGKSYESSSLLTAELKPFQGPALLVCNDAVFSKKDFAGFKDIGQGGKKDDIHSTGMFGRGALSMYHFTDVPMLLSNDSFLVLDPQQNVLPVNYNRRRERKVGTKISLSAVNHLAPDQLAPFVGLNNFAKDLKQYEGTIFRFPLRAVGAKTLLKDHTQHVGTVAVRSLLQDYLAVARTVLLFLRNVESIEFRIRHQKDPQWSVIARRSQRQDSFSCQDVEITSTQGGKSQQVDRWCVDRRTIAQIPANITRFGRGSEKSAECGVATCLTSQKTDGEGDTVMTGQPSHVVSGTIQTIDHRVFCRLPTGHASSLPISFHASFAVTGDRRSIALEDTAENSAWNKWLLTTPVTSLYVEVLQLLAPSLGEKVFDFWPSTALYSSAPTLSGTLCKAFWESLLSQGRKSDPLFPLVAQDHTSDHQDGLLVGNDVSRKLVSLAEATFDFLPNHVSQALRPLLVKLCPTLVRLPQKLWPDYKRTATEAAWASKEMDADYLCQIFFNDENCTALEIFIRGLEHEEDKRTAMAMLLNAMVPKVNGTDTTPLSILGGCRVLPRPNLDAPLGLLLWNHPSSSNCNYVATAQEQNLFAFASDSMVNTELPQDANDLVGMLMKASFNVRRLDFADLGDLLARPGAPTNLSIAFHDRDVWMVKFWDYVNAKMRVLYKTSRSSNPSSEVILDTLLIKGGLCDHPIYRFRSNKIGGYLTPREFEAQPCVIEPLDNYQRQVCEQIPGLRVVDRKCIPFLLLDTEGGLSRAASFRRLLESLEKLERTSQTPTKMFVGKSLNSLLKDHLQALCLDHLRVGKPSNVGLLRSLPIWRRLRTSDYGLSVEHIAAEDAKFCGHSEMLLPWVDNLASFVSPKVVKVNQPALSKLHITPLTSQQTWDIIKADLPANVKAEASRKQYLGMVKYLAICDVKLSGKLAPNGALVLCEVHNLYDHEDPMFKAAFRDQDDIRFLHVDFRTASLKALWLSAGLRARKPTGAMMPEHFLECALAIDRRYDPANMSQTFEADAGIVAAYLQFDRPEFRTWSNWAQISRLQIFRVRDVSPNESSYRQSRMHREKTHCALEEASSLDHVRIVWSQTNFLQNPPCPYVYRTLPRGGIPTAMRVYEHLLFLMAILKDVAQYDLPEYLRDVQACYEHLQNELEATRLIPGVHHARIWLNLDTTQVDLISKDGLQGPTSARLLCLNCPVDPLPIRTARKFLVPYEKLLMGLGCKAVKQPTLTAPGPSTDTRELSLVAAMTEMRELKDRRQLTDVILEAEGIQHPAHKIVLAAVSKYCKAQFAGEWGRLLQHKATVHLEELRTKTLSQMIEFAYTGEFHWPQLQDPVDNTEIADTLDELLDLLDGTNMWMLDRLHGMTQAFLTSPSWSAIYIRVDNVNGIKERAQAARAHRLLKHCEDFESANSDFVEAFKFDDSEVGDGMELS